MPNEHKEVEPLITTDEVARRLGYSRIGIKKMVQRRAIPVIKMSMRSHRFRWSDVQAAIDKRTVPELK